MFSWKSEVSRITPSPIAHDYSPCLPSGRAFSLLTGWYVDFDLPAADRTEPAPQVAPASHVVREPFSIGRASPRQRAPLTRLYHFLSPRAPSRKRVDGPVPAEGARRVGGTVPSSTGCFATRAEGSDRCSRRSHRRTFGGSRPRTEERPCASSWSPGSPASRSA